MQNALTYHVSRTAAAHARPANNAAEYRLGARKTEIEHVLDTLSTGAECLGTS